MLPALAMVCTALVMPAVAEASCKELVASADLRALDASVDVDPLRTITAARAALGSERAAWRRAELHAIVADAYSWLADDTATREAVAAARRELASVPPGTAVDSLAMRLSLVEAGAAQLPAELEAALRSLARWESRVGADAIGKACMLLIRSRVKSRLTWHEQAAEDGLRAHALAARLGARDALIEIDSQLATTFRRAGLLDKALEFADDGIRDSRVSGQIAALSILLYARAQILDEAGRSQDALASAEESERLSLGLRDDVGIAFSNQELCNILFNLQRIDEAERRCRKAKEGFERTGRADQLPTAIHRLASIALLRNRPAEALALIDAAFDGDDSRVAPPFQARLHRVRADALERLGQPAEALSELRHAIQLEGQRDERRHALAGVLLGAQEKLSKAEQAERKLRSELALAQERARSRDLAQKLAYALALGAILTTALLGYLLFVSRRHARDLQRQEAVLRITAENCPDTLVLLDVEGCIRFASRALYDGGELPQRERALVQYLPPEVRAAAEQAVRRLLDRREPLELEFQFQSDGSSARRQYELKGLPIEAHGEVIGATLRSSDVTEHRFTERKVLDIVGRERQRVSGELHDGLGQALTGISLQLRALEAQQRAKGVVDEAMIDEIVSQIDHTIATTRDLARGLSPMQTERGSLPIALAQLAREAGRRLLIDIEFDSVPDEIRAPDDVADHLYRIAFEAVTNAARHGGARHVAIELREEPSSIVLTVGDDGSGFAAPPAQGDGWGLRMIRYRTHLLGGALWFDRSPLGGARVVVTIPSARPGREALRIEAAHGVSAEAG